MVPNERLYACSYFFKFCDVIFFPIKVMVPCYDFRSEVNSNYMPIWHRFQDIGSFNNLLIKLINLINMS